MTRWLRLLLPLVFASTALAQGDALQTWRREQSAIDHDERALWKDFKSRFSAALEEFYRPVSEASEKPDSNKEAVYDYAGLEALYREAKGLAEARAAADDALAASGSEKAAATLFAEFLRSAKQMDAIESDLTDSSPNHGGYTFDQEPSCRIWGLRVLAARRAVALAACAGAVDFLTGDAWSKAARVDGRKSILRRVFVLDALAAANDETAIPFLQTAVADKSAAIRIAAVQAVAPYGEKAKVALEPVWVDPDPAVRRALLRSLPAIPPWFGTVLNQAKRSKGVERDLCTRYLGSISRQTFGLDLERWSKWYDEYKKELEGGKYDAKTIEVREASPGPNPDAFLFYGVPVYATGAAFVIEGSQELSMPADVEFMRTQWRDLWPGTRRKWEEQHPSHQSILLREFEGAAKEFPAGFGWNMTLLFGRFTSKSIGEKKLLSENPRDIREGLDLIENAPAKGWCAAYEGLRTGADLGGKEIDSVDTIILWATGDPAGGHFMTAESAADAWNRFNRFRQLRVIAFRIGNRKEPAEAFMKSIAEASGGVSVRAKQPAAKR